MTFFTGGSSSSSSTTGRVQYAYLSQTSLDALTSGDPDVIYILNEAPYTRYLWNGTELTPMQAVTSDTSNPGSGLGATIDAVLNLYNQSIDRKNHLNWDPTVTLQKTDNYTPTTFDFQFNTIIVMDAGTSKTVTLPPNSSVPAQIGSKIWVLKAGAGNVVIAGGSGVTVISAESLTTSILNTMFECWKIGPNLWYISHGQAGTPAGTPPTTISAPTFTTNPQITYSSAVAGSTMTCSDGTTDVAATITKIWGFTDSITPGGPFAGNIIQAGATVTADTYVTDASDVNSQIWCDVTASNAYGAVTVRALGPIITAAAPAPAPPPSPSTTTPGPRTSVFTASGAITAVSGQTISGKSFSGTGVKVTVPAGVTGVTIEDCTFTGAGNSLVLVQGSSVTIRYCRFHDGNRGILLNSAVNITVQYNIFDTFNGIGIESHAIDNQFTVGPTLIDGNSFIGTYNDSDVVSNFNTSRVTLTNNTFDVTVTEPSSAAFTIGDSLNQQAGRDNYIAFNTVSQGGGGVPCGIFGSQGNTIMEYNCLKAGIQAYNYEGNPFVGVTIRKNVINMGVSFVPNTSIINGWATNVNGTDCSLMPV